MAGMGTAYECPILVWMISLNRDYSQEEYDACYALVKDCVTHVNVQYKPTDPDNFRTLLLAMLPLLMMRHRRIPRAKWRDCVTQNGKHWIEQDDLPPEKFLHSMIGYHLAQDNSLLGMAMTQGPQKKVINIGLGILVHKIPGRATLSSYLESLSHKLTPLEMASITAAPNADSILRRLCIILTLKSSYARAIGQNAAFDWARLEFDIDNKSATADGHALTGWEFRLYRAKLGVARGTEPKLVEEEYQCCCAFFRGCEDLKFVWYEDPKQLESWVQFINIDQMTKVIPKLTA
ncbi:hypothetical protein P691DRAFT_803826 [Macrolepiota fuliginosa MF-IS2]|uniref:holo-[acyl-carrier-protein] synthase n=1 Tax=Macrolepiota fuliginosa MF-IS2 TaxID=1400762 RepID=A0A9P5X8P3_9AGAR|nr:hypothetical protein P691DRAFT_803826 [Macrolepiota fuliginosa MF-IS2]